MSNRNFAIPDFYRSMGGGADSLWRLIRSIEVSRPAGRCVCGAGTRAAALRGLPYKLARKSFINSIQCRSSIGVSSNPNRA